MSDVFYRYIDRRVALPADEWGDATGSEPNVQLREYQVLRHTPKGTWINEGYNPSGRFVLRDARKRFACATVEEALQSFLARKRRQLRILRAQTRHIEDVMAMAQGKSRELPTR